MVSDAAAFKGGFMRALLLAAALIPMLTSCATVTPPPPRSDQPNADVAGQWTGRWVGTGLFESPRNEDVRLDLVQQGDLARGRLVFDGAIAAESISWPVRQQGLSGIRVFGTISGPYMELTHDSDRRLFTANMTVVGDQMVGDVQGSAPNVRLILTRMRAAAPQAAQVTPPPPPPPVAVEPPPPPSPPPPVVAVEPPPPPPPAEEEPKKEEPPARSRIEEFIGIPQLRPVYFGFDQATISPEFADVLEANVAWLKDNDDMLVLVEGHADERGTSEYNLALGERRAKAVAEYLASLGVDTDRISTISYGKERPVCTESTEPCHSQNRRAALKVKSR
jgi:peptidoglycan-associated lipoprotein